MTDSLFGEFRKSVGQQLVERFSSPILGTYAICWGLWNYKFLVILFSSNSVTQTFKLIEEICFPTLSDTLIFFGVPLIFTVVYIYVYPFISLEILKFMVRQRNKINQALQEVDNEKLLSVQESQEIRSNYHVRRAEFAAAIRARDDQIEELQNTIVDLNNKLSKTSPEGGATEASFDKNDPRFWPEVQQEILSFIGEKGGKAIELPSIRLHIFASELDVDYHLEELVRKDIIYRDNEGMDPENVFYGLTHDGRAAYISLQK